MADFAELALALQHARGADSALDGTVAKAFGVPDRDYTGSVEACRALAAASLPGWRLHVGFGASGLFPYAAFRRGDDRFQSEAPTLPLSILRAAVDAARAGVVPA